MTSPAATPAASIALFGSTAWISTAPLASAWPRIKSSPRRPGKAPGGGAIRGGGREDSPSGRTPRRIASVSSRPSRHRRTATSVPGSLSATTRGRPADPATSTPATDSST